MIMMCGAAALLALKWRKTRPVDWMLMFVFSVSALLATRNIVLVGIWAPVLIAGYAPSWEDRKREGAAWVLLGGVIALSAYYLTFFFSFVTMAAIAAMVFSCCSNDAAACAASHR